MTLEDYTILFRMVDDASASVTVDGRTLQDCSDLVDDLDEIAQMRAVIESIEPPALYYTTG